MSKLSHLIKIFVSSMQSAYFLHREWIAWQLVVTRSLWTGENCFSVPETCAVFVPYHLTSNALEKSDIESLLHHVTFDNFQLSVPAPEKKCLEF